MTNRTLTIGQAVNLAIVIGWAQSNVRLAWIDTRGDVNYGTARSIGTEEGAHAGRNDDVRDCYLRITTDHGMEWFVPMADVLERLADGLMVQDSSGR